MTAIVRPLRIAAVVSIAAGLSGFLAAQTPNLNVKPGLWEVTMVADMGPMGGVDTSKMPPAQQAQIEAMMKGRGMAPTVIKNCITKEQVDQQKFTTDRPGQTCVQKIIKTTATSVDINQTCTGAEPSVSEIHVEATTPTSMKTIVKQTSGRGGQMTMTLTGKWLGADCSAK